MIPTDEEAEGTTVASVEQTNCDDLGQSEPASETEEVAAPAPSGSDEGKEKSDEEAVPPSRLYRFAKKLMDRKELAEDTKDLMVAVLSTSDRAKTEMVRMTAREVRNYLDELRLKEELVKLVRSHSLEVKASFSLKPIEGMLNDDSAEEGED